MAGREGLRWGRGRRGITAGALVLGLVTVTACGSSSDLGGDTDALPGQGSAAGAAQAPPGAPPAVVTITPAAEATGVSPTAPVEVKVAAGALQSVQVTNPEGEPVEGTLSEDRTRWVSAEPLGYAKTYAVSATAVNADNRTFTTTSSFSTVTPDNYTLPYFTYTQDGGTYGVGQPVVVRFDEPIPDQAAAERTLTVTTNPPVEGAWHWINNREVHWRPPDYWAAGTEVTVTAKVYGVHMGDGLYGQEDRSVNFTIGSSKIAVADDSTHMMQVFIDGEKVRDIPISMGRGGQVEVNGNTINFTTASGPHVVTEKHRVKEMSSATYGLPEDNPQGYNTTVEWAVRISADGEFVHSAPWSVADQGRRNVSHGCINVSPEHAKWFYDTFGPGDVVDIRGTSRPLQYTNGLSDWVLPWEEWVEGSALR